jgi:hypothetical protein
MVASKVGYVFGVLARRGEDNTKDISWISQKEVG